MDEERERRYFPAVAGQRNEAPAVFSSQSSTIAFLVAAVAITVEIVLHIVGAAPLLRAVFLAGGGAAALTVIVLLRRARANQPSSKAAASSDEDEYSIGRPAKVVFIEAAVIWAAAVVLAVVGAAVSTWVGFLFAGCVFASVGLYWMWRGKR